MNLWLKYKDLLAQKIEKYYEMTDQELCELLEKSEYSETKRCNDIIYSFVHKKEPLTKDKIHSIYRILSGLSKNSPEKIAYENLCKVVMLDLKAMGFDINLSQIEESLSDLNLFEMKEDIHYISLDEDDIGNK
jgi:hypothetical protein